VPCVAVGYLPALRGSSHLFVSTGFRSQRGRPPQLDGQRLRTHLDGLLGLGCNGLSGRFGGGFHVEGDVRLYLGREAKEGYRKD
jgi:hypothetical protein